MTDATKVGAVAPNGLWEITSVAKAVEGNGPYRENHLWHGPGAPDLPGRRFDAKAVLWSLVFPAKRHRISPTVPGIFLMFLAMGIGTAAYNTASNILFIALSLLLACLLLSGLLSWFNFTGVCWRLVPQGPWRAGHEAIVLVDIQNRKKWLPTYSLWFELNTQPRRPPVEEKPAKDMKIREVLAAIDRLVTRGKVHLRERIEPRGETQLEWLVKPVERGEAYVELAAVGSLFPFGFLKKNIGVAVKQSVLVWPAQVSYQWSGASAARSGAQGQRTARAGRGDDLLALRNYTPGDSHRLIHWKASARLGQLMTRQFAAESHDGYTLRFDTPAAVWARREQFELLCSFVATLAEDLFASGRLRGVSVNGGPLLETRRMRDLEAVLDQLARVEPLPDAELGFESRTQARPASASTSASPRGRSNKNIISFAPEGARGVAAYVDGQQAATA